MYERSRTVVRCAVGQTAEFKVEVGLHQGSALSPFLFAIVMDQLSEEVRQESPWTMMFADDIVICSESREQVEENLERWRFALERRGMKVSHSKTEYMCVNEREGSGTVRLQGEEVKKVQEFKYLGSTVQSNGECGKEPCPCLTTSVESPETNARGTLPREYSDLQEVFSKVRATHLPPHRPWDCAIKLFPNAMLPKNRVYPLSLPETKAMEDYIEEALSAGHIHISTSPVAAGFFFVKKKDGGLHPCIDYCGLNAITVCYPYPFPLVSAALEQLQGANIFSNWIYGVSTISFESNGITILNERDIQRYSERCLPALNNTTSLLNWKGEFCRKTFTFLGYVLSPDRVEMDQTKVKAVTEWPEPTTVKELQQFLGFANIYGQFIRNYSTIAGPPY
ncbi:hypothetical protein QTP86_014214 [Hemibagrus guttatus]|nr:hypothetical protein QTP86_014214 [Hemibagrus guttatus]